MSLLTFSAAVGVLMCSGMNTNKLDMHMSQRLGVFRFTQKHLNKKNGGFRPATNCFSGQKTAIVSNIQYTEVYRLAILVWHWFYMLPVVRQPVGFLLSVRSIEGRRGNVLSTEALQHLILSEEGRQVLHSILQVRPSG